MKQPVSSPKFQIIDSQTKKLVDSLDFCQMDTRQLTIKTAHSQTCKWLFEQPEYLDWLTTDKLAENRGFLWIKGKAGAGKSTLMKFAAASARKDMEVVSFFFNARGEDLEKSTIGMYRSILSQILHQLPNLQCVLTSTLHLRSCIRNRRPPDWSIELLKTLFDEVVQNLKETSLACFIDALDECNERDIRDMLSFFEHLVDVAASTGAEFRICFASRHYPHISISKGVNLVLEGQDGHRQDIGMLAFCSTLWPGESFSRTVMPPACSLLYWVSYLFLT